MKNIKWLFSVCLMVVFVCFSWSGVRAEETEIDTSVFEYRENEDGTIFISDYTGTDETVIIPAEIDGKAVTGIGVGSFSQCKTVKYLIISEGIMDILDNGFDGTFYSCENLETVSLPSTLKTIGKKAFSGCHKLREINLPEGLVSIGEWAFIECSKLNNVILPEGLINIGDRAFCNCYSIERLIIPDSVTYIGEGAFNISYDDRIPIYGNPDAYIKTYCDTIDKKVKFSCINHANIVTDPAVAPNCKEAGKTEGSHCTVCGTVVIKQQRIPPNELHDWKFIYTREATIKKKGYNTYKCTVCDEYKNEEIPKATVPKKGDVISGRKTHLYKVTKSGTRNGTVEFLSPQSSKNNIIVPYRVRIAGIFYRVTSIGKNAFKNNENLKKVTINENITKINANAFRGCSNLKLIIIKSRNLSLVGKNAFKGINPKAKIKVPSNCLEEYKKLLAKKGQKSSVKITK